MHGLRVAIPKTNPVATCEFAALGERLIKIGARDRAHCAHPRAVADELIEGTLLRNAALGLLLSGPCAAGPAARRAADPGSELT
jgi:hypothetical protein